MHTIDVGTIAANATAAAESVEKAEPITNAATEYKGPSAGCTAVVALVTILLCALCCCHCNALSHNVCCLIDSDIHLPFLMLPFLPSLFFHFPVYCSPLTASAGQLYVATHPGCTCPLPVYRGVCCNDLGTQNRGVPSPITHITFFAQTAQFAVNLPQFR